MDVLLSFLGGGVHRVEVLLFEEGVESSVFKGVCGDVVVFFELDAGWELWDVLSAASDSFRVEFGL